MLRLSAPLYFLAQAEILLGRTADALAEAREEDPARFAALLQSAKWSSWALRIKATAQ